MTGCQVGSGDVVLPGICRAGRTAKGTGEGLRLPEAGWSMTRWSKPVEAEVLRVTLPGRTAGWFFARTLLTEIYMM
jgi:hypothetical protein